MQFRQIDAAIAEILSVMLAQSAAANRGLVCFPVGVTTTRNFAASARAASHCEELQRYGPYRLRYWCGLAPREAGAGLYAGSAPPRTSGNCVPRRALSGCAVIRAA